MNNFLLMLSTNMFFIKRFGDCSMSDSSVESEKSQESDGDSSGDELTIDDETAKPLSAYDSYEEYYREEVEKSLEVRAEQADVDERKILAVKVCFYLLIAVITGVALVFLGLVAIDIITHLFDMAGEHF